jgi:hypothetical protein
LSTRFVALDAAQPAIQGESQRVVPEEDGQAFDRGFFAHHDGLFPSHDAGG